MENTKISTHTPVRVWLFGVAPAEFSPEISTHTPVRVWHLYSQYVYNVIGNFNSHTREGVTGNQLIYLLIICRFQLTHPWGCDKSEVIKISSSRKFQLTHPWGCDDPCPSLAFIFLQFQLTHPWGCDDETLSYYECLCNFNSHTREGVTIHNAVITLTHIISTHTPVRVWRCAKRWNGQNYWHFNSHTREGVT